MPKGRGSPIRFNYADNIPGYDAGDNPLGDYADRERPPQDTPPQDTPPQDPPADIPPDYQDPGLGGSDGESDGSNPSHIPPQRPDGVYVPPEGPEVRPGDFDGDGIPNEFDPDHYVTEPEDFKPHYMYNPNTGEAVYVTTFEEHLHWEGMGYVHEKPSSDGSGNDYALIGVISLLFFGGLILGLRK